MPIRWTADSTDVTADSTVATADAEGEDPNPNGPNKRPKYIGGGAGGDLSVLFPGISLQSKPLRGPKRLSAKLKIDPSPVPIPTRLG